MLEAYRKWATTVAKGLPKDKGPYLEGRIVPAHYLYNDKGSRSARDINIHQPNVGDGKEW